MPNLSFRLNDGNEFVFEMIEDRLRLGRTPDNDIVIDHVSISAHHAEFIRQEGGGYEVIDLKSSNGTYVNGKLVSRSNLIGGDRLEFGQLAVSYREQGIKGREPSKSSSGGLSEALSVEEREKDLLVALAELERERNLDREDLERERERGRAQHLFNQALNERRVEREKECAALEDKRARAEKELMAVESSATVLQGEVTELLEVLKNLQKTKQKLEEEIAQQVKDCETTLIEMVKRTEEEVERARKGRAEREVQMMRETDVAAAILKELAIRREVGQRALVDLEKEISDGRQRAIAARGEAEAQERVLRELLDRGERLRDEEAVLTDQVETHKNDLRAAGDALGAMHMMLDQLEPKHIAAKEGAEAVAMKPSVAELERHRKAVEKALREASEKELAMQVRLSALQEELNREAARVEQMVKDRATLEVEFQAFVAEMKADANKLRALQSKLEREQQQLRQVEQRLRSQLEELVEKHEMLRVELPTDEATVIMFATDLIKRIDLIDVLMQKFWLEKDQAAAEQLFTLRASFEDILYQHGVLEFDVDEGTEVDVELRKRIVVVESEPGPNRAKVMETFRTGFVLVCEDGREIVLRKVEVKTSSL